MTFDEYVATERAKYDRLASVVESILKAAIDGRGDLRLQHTQKRAKEPRSLERKLKRNGHFDAKDIESYAKDLAGCRLVFYTNSDVSAFLASRIIVENFEVDWDRTKIHHPDLESEPATEQFVSNNYVVRLKADRAILPEYLAVAGIWCEVQVQTTLNHAWAEMAHDTIYKKPDLPGGFGVSLMQQIEKRMADIMRQHLLPAGYEFQKVLTDFERLSTGKELFDRGLLKAVSECEDNNARYDLLQRFSEYVLPHYDDIRGVYDEIRSALRQAVTSARITVLKPIETPFGNLPGHTTDDIVNQVAAVIERLRYVDVQSTFDFLVEMFSGALDPGERSRWTKSAEELAKHEIPAWEKVGPAVQLTLLARIKRLPRELKESVRPLLVAILRKILETEITGTTAEFDKIVFGRGPIQFTRDVRTMRRDAIRLLKLFALTAKEDSDRRDAMSAIREGTRLPDGASDDLLLEVIDNSRDIVGFYTTSAKLMSYESLESLEHSLLWLYRHTAQLHQEGEPSKVDRARLNLREAIIGFRDHVNSDMRFVTYKTLVGYESVFPPAWESDEFDVTGIDEYRSQRIDEFVATLSDESAESWLDIIRLCASTQSNDLATFPKFGEFLEKVAKAKPKLAIRFLKAEEELLANFLPSITLGIEGAPTYRELLALMTKWVRENKFLSQIVWVFRSTKNVDTELLCEAMKGAIEHNDRQTLFNLVTVADLRNADVTGGLVDRILIPAIGALTDSGDHRWPNAVWGRRADSAFNSLSDTQAQFVLSALISVPRLDWREEEILSTIAISKPKAVIDFFGERLDAKLESEAGYEPIPFQFYSLHEQLVKEASYAVDVSHRWFGRAPALFAYRGGRFVANVFSHAWTILELELRKFVDGKNPDLNFVVQVLRTFEGEEFLHPLVQEIIDRLEPESELLEEVDLVLSESGVVSGEFGFVELYKKRRDQITNWLGDERPRVREFAEKHIRSLERRIAAEKRRAEQDYELRKRNWGSGEDKSEA